MNINDRQKALDKIKRCLALGQSANEHEAAVAMRQARVLMDKFQITDNDIALLDITEASTRAGSTIRPAEWEANLAVIVAKTMQCQAIFVSKKCIGAMGLTRIGEWNFVGVDPSPEIATYAFSVLSRQIRKARTDYIKTALKRVKVAANKTRRADLFCDGWIDTASRLIVDLSASNPATMARVDQYMARQHQNLKDLKTTDRNAGRNFGERDFNDHAAGRAAGQSAQLNRGMGGERQKVIGA
jgi:hypothetical protein